MKKLRIGLLYGGRSGEHEVSLMSAASIFRHLNREKYTLLPIGISKAGVWYRQNFTSADGPALPLEEEEQDIVSLVPGKGIFAGGERLLADFVFPVLHGTFGEDGTVQGLLELLDLPYAGAGVFASALGMDKEQAKALWKHAGLPVVPWLSLSKREYDKNPSAAIQDCEGFGLPLFVKPVRAGSSVGITKVKTAADVALALQSAFRYDDRILVEKAVKAREIECSVIGNDEIRVFPPGEVKPSHEFYDYDAKYLDPEGAVLTVPADLPPETMELVMRTAGKAYTVLGMKGFARLDFFIEVRGGGLYINEINTIPGFTSISMFPRMCEAAGLTYPDLLDRIIELGMERFREKAALQFSR